MFNYRHLTTSNQITITIPAPSCCVARNGHSVCRNPSRGTPPLKWIESRRKRDANFATHWICIPFQRNEIWHNWTATVLPLGCPELLCAANTFTCLCLKSFFVVVVLGGGRGCRNVNPSPKAVSWKMPMLKYYLPYTRRWRRRANERPTDLVIQPLCSRANHHPSTGSFWIMYHPAAARPIVIITKGPALWVLMINSWSSQSSSLQL